MEKRWNIKKTHDVDQIQKLSNEINVSHTVANLLLHRGITSYEDAKRFFRPALSDLHDPYMMLDMDKAVERIEKAIHSNEKILVFGDYDVDGTTAVALVYSFLKTLHPDVEYYIPDRYAEGYGISFTGIDFAHANGFTLIIALDCGIKSVDKIAYASKKNIDFVICDHHLPGDVIPDAVAVLDPKQKNCNYPYKELSGCGIGFKLIQALAKNKSIDQNELEQYLDLVVISIASDIVPVTGENRVLAFYGLKRLNTNPRHGIKALLHLSNINRTLSISDIVFIIGPRINAAGRIESGNKAVALLISDNTEQAILSGESVNKNNSERRDLDMLITTQALNMISSSEVMINRKSTVVYDPQWHKGVIGIVASRLTDKYYRPTVVLTKSNGKITGSARSVKNFDLYAALESCSELLEQFGGHKYAAGLTMDENNVDAFSKKFEEIVASSIEEHMLIPEIEIDTEINFSEITPNMINVLKQFGPFGPGNMAPVFSTKSVVDTGFSKVVGNNHLKLSVFQPENKNVRFNAIAFNMSDKLYYTEKKLPFDICYSIEEHSWNNQVSVQLNVKDIKI